MSMVAVSAQQGGKLYQYVNGQWFNGMGFDKKVMYVQHGMFVGSPSRAADSVIDLQNLFVIPPFGEAHTHLLEGMPDIDMKIRAYLKHGVFYVKNPNNVREWTKNIFSKINKPTSIDGSFANAGITITGGHPQVLYEEVVLQHLKGAIPGIEKSWFKNRAFFNANNEVELNNIWPVIKEGKPDFIKIYLANSEDIGNYNDPGYKLRKGLDLTMAKLIVAKAHHEKLRVSAHVETAADFRLALEAGVDEINHTPGFYIVAADKADRYKLTEADAVRAAKQNVTVVTTFHSSNLIEDQSLLPLSRKVQGDNLKLLHKHGVAIAIGSDHADSPVREIEVMQELKLFDNLTLLKMWTENTAKTIFPGRKVGYLKEGYEASFLVMSYDPITSLKPINEIVWRVKQGVFIIMQQMH